MHYVLKIIVWANYRKWPTAHQTIHRLERPIPTGILGMHITVHVWLGSITCSNLVRPDTMGHHDLSPVTTQGTGCGPSYHPKELIGEHF